MKKLLTREIITDKAKRIIREPLLYLLPLLALAGLWIIPAKSNISDVMLITDGNSYPASLPLSTEKIRQYSNFSISFNIDVKDNKNLIYRFYPDDCILGIEINGRAFPQEMVKEPCAYYNGTLLDLSEYTQKGLNRIEIQMKNNGGVGGLVIKSLHFHSVGFKHILFSVLLLITVVLILYKFKISVANLKKIPFYLLPVIALLLYAFVEFCFRLQYESNELFNMDTTIYQAVGRGIVNGISPWSGLWDIKPPGIFLLNAISYKIFETPILTDYFQCFVLIVIVVIPVVFWFVFPNRSIWKFIICALFGFAMALYSAERSGEVQTESLGASFGCIAVFAFAYPNFYKRKKLLIAISAIGILGACGFKEPFLFPILAASILLCENLKDWCFRFLLPLGIAIIAGFLLLLIFGWFGDFLHYFEFMQQFWVNRFGSPYKRAMQFWILWEDMNAFSYGLGWILVVLLFSPFILHKENLPNIAIKTLVAFLLTCFAVGLGGEYYSHHFIFAIPFYFALFAMLLNAEKNINFASIILVLLSVTVLNLPNSNLEVIAINKERVRQEQLKEAAYIDAVLEKTGFKRYMYLGRNGEQVYAWTTHSPEGPYFIQYTEWMRDIPEFRETVFSMILNSQLVVMGQIQEPVRIAVQPILDQYFTMEPWTNVLNIPRPEHTGYKIYYRKK